MNLEKLIKKTGDFYLAEFIESNYDYLTHNLGIDFKRVYGCGFNGCVFPTRNPEIVAKITEDKLEILYYRIIQAKSYTSPLFPDVYSIENKFGFNPKNFHVILREAVIPMEEKDLNSKNKSYIRKELDNIDLNIQDVKKDNLGFSVIDDRIVLFDGQVVID